MDIYKKIDDLFRLSSLETKLEVTKQILLDIQAEFEDFEEVKADDVN